MTKIKTISIPDYEDCFTKLNDITPNNMSFSKQVRSAVAKFVDDANNIDDVSEYIQDVIPSYDSPIEDWIKYIGDHPEHVGNIMRRHIQLGNILRKEKYAIQ
jgi:hypothetical protein